jgi:hypothetical protein
MLAVLLVRFILETFKSHSTRNVDFLSGADLCLHGFIPV